ncbi:MAG: tripartite tricarboxylate transporter TctB family protein [Verrucomicrobia bacterium]|nr:tripartite tricarboxylate transporter TctB family protein [Verrucomicrobiota bacterium]
MRLNDTLSGWLMLILGLTIVACALTFPPMPGQNIGPALFPQIIGGGLAFCGVALVRSGRRAGGPAWVEMDDWVGRPRMVFNFALVVGALVFYALAVDTLGFFITGFVFLAGLFFSFGVRRRWIAPVAAAVTLALHFGFYTLLRVPLPWGWLERFAW